MWVCPRCGRGFANPNQSHACGPLDLAHHFEGRSGGVRATYATFRSLLEENGPVPVLPEKTTHRVPGPDVVRTADPAATLGRRPSRAHPTGDDPAFTKVETFSPRSHLHAFRLDGPDEVEKLRPSTPEAYAVGRQDHLHS
jgi:hypothetical protein